MLDVCRYQKINVDAKSRSEVYPGEAAMAAERNVSFLAACVQKFPRLNFAERKTGRIYARFAAGHLEWADPEALEIAIADTDTHDALRVVAPRLFDTSKGQQKQRPERLASDRFPTLWRWGPSA